MNRVRLLAAVGAGLSISCSHQEARDPLAFRRPTSFDTSCPGVDVVAKVDVSTAAPVTEVMRSRNGWTVTTTGGTQRFGLNEGSEPRSDTPLGPFCQHAAQANRASVARDVDGVCFLGIDRGEFGGSWMEEIAPGPPPTRVALAGGARWILPAGASGRSLVVIGGVAHPSVAGGAFYRLDRSPEGTWCRGQTVALRGSPVAWRADGPRRYAILVFGARPSGNDAAPPASPTGGEQGGPDWYYVVRVDDEGRLLPVEQPSVSIE
jgi:hypothetical protein